MNLRPHFKSREGFLPHFYYLAQIFFRKHANHLKDSLYSQIILKLLFNFILLCQLLLPGKKSYSRPILQG